MNLNQAIIKSRVELQDSTIKKTGKNKHAGFSYFELKDFLPTLNVIMSNNDLNDRYTIEDGNATLYIIKGEESNKYSMPFTMFDTPLANSGKKMMQDIQYLGALNTYYKRYLYLNAFGITDGEIIEGIDNNDIPQQTDEELQMAAIRTQALIDKKKLPDELLIECGNDTEQWKTLMSKVVKDLGADKYNDIDFLITSKAVFKGKFMEELKLAEELKASGL